MTIEDRIAKTLGDLLLANARQASIIDDLNQRIAELEKNERVIEVVRHGD